MSLGIYVFGGSKGESIVLRLPDDSWGVVDCYTNSKSDVSKNPVVEFLKNEGVKRLSFVCLTHGHDDHFLGLRQVLAEFAVDEFWHPDVMTTDRLASLLKAKLRKEKQVDPDKNKKTNAAELAELWNVIGERRKKGLKIQRVGLGSVCISAEQMRDFSIEGIGPSENQGHRFEEKLKHCFDADGSFKWSLKHRDVNYSSIGLLIKHGTTKVILGGDIEDGGWKDLLSERPFMVESVNFVKVAHHGSENGYCSGLWQKHVQDTARTVKVLTPFKTFDLPSPKLVDHISQYGGDFYCAGFPYNDTEFVPTLVSSLSALQKQREESKPFDSRVDVEFDDAGQVTNLQLHGRAEKIC